MTSYVVLILFLAAFVMSVVLHEVAHGWVARACGDHTAEMAGRLSLNPIRHIDPFMTIAMPILMLIASGGRFMFGGAKPVPINPYHFRNMEIDDLKVSLAGVTVNLSIAAVFGFSVHLFEPETAGFTLFAMIAILNLLLAFFNLLPIPPLDGSHVMRFVLARFSRDLAAAYDRLSRMGMIVLVICYMVFRRQIGYVLGTAIDAVWVHVFSIDEIHWWQVIEGFRNSFG